jgi:glyoxylase-like metal-dependent hydrolase (beta-lactamase superfamily II)
MRLTQEGNLLQLTWLPGLFPVNCYLLIEDHELTLIDAGMSYCLKGIVNTARRLDKPITRIILTHAHEDHVGALDALKQLYPQAVVYISSRDAALLAGDQSLRPGEPQTPIKGSVPSKVSTKPDILLEDGDTVGSLIAISTPGHTPGSMSFQDCRSNAIIAGDAFQTFGRVAVAGTVVPWFPFPAMATWNKEQAAASAERLLMLSPSVFAVGHGDLLKAPVHSMKQAISIAHLQHKKAGK